MVKSVNEKITPVQPPQEELGRGTKVKAPKEGEMEGQRKVTLITVIQDNYKLGFFHTIQSLWHYIWGDSKSSDTSNEWIISTSEAAVQAAAPVREPGKAKIWQILDEMHETMIETSDGTERKLLPDNVYDNLTGSLGEDNNVYTYPELQAKINNELNKFEMSGKPLVGSNDMILFWSEKFAAGRKAEVQVPAITAVAYTVIKMRDFDKSTFQDVIDDMVKDNVVTATQAQVLSDLFISEPAQSYNDIKQKLDKVVNRFETQNITSWKAPLDSQGQLLPGGTSVKDRMAKYWKEHNVE